jgi:HD superfamily phosphohydrolase
MPEKIVRDPVHDVIAFHTERPGEKLLFELINAAEFQRLRRIRQLGLAALAYPGADHSRYSHSLGVMETARRMLAQLAREFPISEQEQTTCLAAALLHDLGHGPFSHVFERVSGIEHESLTARVIVDPQSEVNALLRRHDPQLPQQVVGLLQHRPGPGFLSDCISSQLDADRFDYLLRDNLMTGSQYGAYDLEWLLHALTIDTQGNRLAVHARGVSAVEAFLQSRYHMYRNVYFHKVVRSAEGMVKLALQRAKRLAIQGRLNWPTPDHTVHAALLGRQLTHEQFIDLDDVSMLHCFKVWTGGEDAILARLCRGLLYRRLFKAIELPAGMPPAEAQSLLGKARAAITAAGGDADYELFYDEPADTLYDAFDASLEEVPGREARPICVVAEDGRVSSLSEHSTLPAAFRQQLMFRRLHVSEAYEQTVAALL